MACNLHGNGVASYSGAPYRTRHVSSVKLASYYYSGTLGLHAHCRKAVGFGRHFVLCNYRGCALSEGPLSEVTMLLLQV